MATKTITQFIDDLDGSEDGVETVSFGLHGAVYDIDLTKANQDKLDAALEPFLAVARKSSSRTSATSRSGAPRNGGPAAYDAKAVRRWAADNNLTVPARGRIPGAVIAQYQAALR